MYLKSRALKTRVSAKLTDRVVNSFLRHVQQSKVKLWGVGCKNPKKKLVRYASLLALYKDITGKSYKELITCLPKEIKWSNNTIHHNQRVLRHKMSEWADITMNTACINKY